MNTPRARDGNKKPKLYVVSRSTLLERARHRSASLLSSPRNHASDQWCLAAPYLWPRRWPVHAGAWSPFPRCRAVRPRAAQFDPPAPHSPALPDVTCSSSGTRAHMRGVVPQGTHPSSAGKCQSRSFTTRCSLRSASFVGKSCSLHT